MLISFETLVDPAGSISAWMSNWIATSAPKYTLRALLKQAALPSYQVKVESVHLSGFKGVIMLPSNAKTAGNVH